MIEIENLHMNFGPVKAVDGLNLTIPKGEFFAFLGPNAAGKTTTIKVLTGLLSPDQGTVRICGHDIQKEPIAAKSLIGYVPDVAVFYDKLTPPEFMRFIADLFSVDPSAAQERTEKLFDQFGLHDYNSQRIENLSHGTKQRLAITSALLHNPEVIIIDEPMVGLDPIYARTVREELQARSEAGTTVLMSTHLLNIAEDLADRIGIIHHGKLIALGTLEEIQKETGKGGQELEEMFLEMVSD